MSQGRGLPPPPKQLPIEIIWVHRDQLHPNGWNPNKMTAFMYAKAYESISENGFFDPILCRPHPEKSLGFQIIDGEHRWMVGSDLGMDTFPVIVRDVDDVTAKKLTLIANELHGQADPQKVTELLREILESESPEEMLKGMPFTEDTLKGFLGFDPLPPLPPAPQPPASRPPSDAGGSPGEKWVERTYRMPEGAADVISLAIGKVKGMDPKLTEDWQALEMIAAEFIAS